MCKCFISKQKLLCFLTDNYVHIAGLRVRRNVTLAPLGLYTRFHLGGTGPVKYSPICRSSLPSCCSSGMFLAPAELQNRNVSFSYISKAKGRKNFWFCWLATPLLLQWYILHSADLESSTFLDRKSTYHILEQRTKDGHKGRLTQQGIGGQVIFLLIYTP